MTSTAKPGALQVVFRSLRYRNYRLFFMGQMISLIGTWMQMVAMSWLVYRMTDSPFLLGLVGFSSQIPSFLVAPFAGVWIDRLDKRNLLVATQTLYMLLALALAILTFHETITIQQIVALSVLGGLLHSVDMPARQSFLVEMIEDKQDLGNAIALNSSMFNGARLVGPAVAGLLVTAFGEAWCFLANSLSYLAVLAALLAMNVASQRRGRPDTHIFQELREGFTYASRFPPIRAILLLLAMVSLLGSSFSVLMPVFAKTILGGNAGTLGLLMSAAGAGALVGAAHLAARKTVLGLGRLLAMASGLFGAGVFIFSLSTSLWLSVGILLFVGFGMMVQTASANTLLQTIVDDDKRGRVMSFYTMAFVGMMPFGSLLAGYLADLLGPQTTVALSGMACLAGAAAFAIRLPSLRAHTHPVYVRLGILPSVPPSVQPAPNSIISPNGSAPPDTSSPDRG